MHTPNWNDDEILFQDLREALRPVPVDRRLIDTAEVAYGRWTVEADLALAELLYDSDTDRAALVRGPVPAGPRIVVFGHGELRVELELSESGVEGQLVPPEAGQVRLISDAGPIAEAIADEVGCFAFPARPRRPIRFECRLPAGGFVTEWIMLR